MSDLDRYLTDAVVEKAAKELYEQWASRDSETRMFAPMWDSLGPAKFGWIRDARIALEDAAPDIIRQAKAEALREMGDWFKLASDLGTGDRDLIAAQACYDRADRIEQGGQP